MSLLVLALDRDVAAHLAVAIHRYLSAAQKNGISTPLQLADLRAAALESAGSTVTKRHEASPGFVVLAQPEDDPNDRDYLSRQDVRHLTGASLSTIDRWIASGRLPSRRQGRMRRIARGDLDRFIGAA